MLAKTPLFELAIAWLEQQDPKTQYDWRNPHACACAKIADALGCADKWNADAGYSYVMIKRSQDWYELNVLARGNVCGEENREWTFGAFLGRLKASLSA